MEVVAVDALLDLGVYERHLLELAVLLHHLHALLLLGAGDPHILGVGTHNNVLNLHEAVGDLLKQREAEIAEKVGVVVQQHQQSNQSPLVELFHLRGAQTLHGEDLLIEDHEVQNEGAVLCLKFALSLEEVSRGSTYTSQQRDHQKFGGDQLQPGKGEARVLDRLQDVQGLHNRQQHRVDIIPELVLSPVKILGSEQTAYK